MKIPTKEECIEMLKKYEVPERIIIHSEKVADVAVFLGSKLVEKGEKINLKLVLAGAMLHDLDKMKTLEDLKKHGRMAYNIITQEGYLKVASLVIKHNLKSMANGDITQWEEFLVNYADKRVMDINIVSLDQRLEAGIKTHGPFEEKELKAVYKAEADLFTRLDFEPDQLAEQINGGNTQ